MTTYVPTLVSNPNAVRDIGPGLLYFAPLGTAEPTDLTAAFPTGWLELGFTSDGHTFTHTPQTADTTAAETLYPIRTRTTGVTEEVSVSLEQITVQNFDLAMNGGSKVPSGSVTTYNPPVLGTEQSIMLAWESEDLLERMIWRKCFQTGAVAIARGKAGTAALMPVTFRVQYVGGGVLPWTRLSYSPTLDA